MAFNPDEYLAQKSQPSQGGFDPDAYLAQKAPQETSMMQDVGQGIGNLAAGAVRGAGSIGATILSPLDYSGITGMTNEERRAKIDEGLQSMGAQPESMLYKGGKLAGEIAGTAGAGGVLARGLSSIPAVAAAAPIFTQAVSSGGMVANGAGLGVRAAGGALTGGAMAGMVNPEDIVAGATLGAAFPVAGKLAGESGRLLREYAINPMFRPSQAAINQLVKDAGGAEQAKMAIEKAIEAGKTLSGESYTLGQASKNAGLAATERARSAINPENYQHIYQAQRDARIAAMQKIAGGSDDVSRADSLGALKNARTEATEGLYSGMQNTPFQLGAEGEQLMTRARPYGALGHAEKLAATQGRKFSIPVAEDVNSAAMTMVSASPQRIPQEIVDRVVRGGDLQAVKQGIDQVISSSEGPQKRALMQLKNDYLKFMESKSPEYIKANSIFSDMSQPITEMSVAQRMVDTLTGEAYKHGGDAPIATTKFLQAYRNAPLTARSVSGVRKPIEKIFTPDNLETVRRVAREVSKQGDLERLGRGVGSDTVQKAARSNLMSSLADLVNSNRVVRSSVNLATLGAKGRVNNQLDAMLQSPSYAGKAFNEFTAAQKNRLADLIANPAVRAGAISYQSK